MVFGRKRASSPPKKSSSQLLSPAASTDSLSTPTKSRPQSSAELVSTPEVTAEEPVGASAEATSAVGSQAMEVTPIQQQVEQEPEPATESARSSEDQVPPLPILAPASETIPSPLAQIAAKSDSEIEDETKVPVALSAQRSGSPLTDGQLMMAESPELENVSVSRMLARLSEPILSGQSSPTDAPAPRETKLPRASRPLALEKVCVRVTVVSELGRNMMQRMNTLPY